MKKCTKCGEEKELEEFRNKSGAYDGKQSWCKPCSNRGTVEYWQRNPKKSIIKRARWSAKKHGIPFNLTIEDIVIPEICPVFKKPFIYGKGRQDFSVSIDRINPHKGYVKGNIIIVSDKANRTKNDATIEELRILTNFYESL